jgi:hypothetical protein
MERLKQLRQEFELAKKVLAFPFTVEEHLRNSERRSAILMEARALAASLNIAGEHWLDAGE